MFQYEVIHNGPILSEKQLDRILHSKIFELAFRGFADRNPYYARTFFRNYPMPLIADLCGIALYASQRFADEVEAQGYSCLDEYEAANKSEFLCLRETFYASYATDEEPEPMKYPQIIAMLEDAKITLSDDQKQSLEKLTGEISDEECAELVKRCRESVELFGWQTMDNKPLYKE